MSACVGVSALGALALRASTAIAIAVPLFASPAAAQGWPSTPEIRPFVGMYVPTGRHHALLDRGVALGAQVALEFGRGTHAVAGFSWVPTEQRGIATPARVEIAQFDLGAEWLSPGPRRLDNRFNPLVGAGVGLRAYRSRDTDTPSQANVAGYGALGFEVRLGRVAMRLEGRDYLTAFRGLAGDDGTSMRNDVTVALGIGYHMR